MSLSGALSNAASGLAAASRAAQVVSSNVANAMTEGYAPRRVEMVSVSVAGEGAGVRVASLRREVDVPLMQEHRLARAARAAADTPLEGLRALERAFGAAEGEDSLAARLAGLETALIQAASRPEDSGALARVLAQAEALTGHLGDLGGQVQEHRGAADRAIAADVARMNDSLSRIATLNEDIRVHRVAGRDAAALLDERQRLVDGIAPLVPLRESTGPHEVLRLTTASGATLVDGASAARLDFQPANLVTEELTLQGGGLSMLTLNGRPATPDWGGAGPLDGGRLAGLGGPRRPQLPPRAR
ncbi:MAG: flagellar hook-associated protein FlgK, partial [Rhodobacteraceae bacterium]|nr:flagellar hook-associated protein FlgK [Paracoccaceae bacterium]